MSIKHVSFLILLCIPLPVYAQNAVNGIVTDAKTGKPVENVHILIPGASDGIITDSKGNFNITDPSLPLVIELTHIGYHKKEFTVMNLEFQHITMDAKTTHLGEFTVSAAAAENISGGSNFLVLDYEFTENKLLLLCRDFASGEYLLKLTRLNGDLISEKILGKKPEKLYRDCEGIIYLLFKKGAQVIKNGKEAIEFAGFYSSAAFNAISRCIIELNDRYYFEVYSPNKQKMSLFCIHKKNNKEVIKVKEITDEIKEKMWADEIRFRTMAGFEFTEFDEAFASMAIYNPVYAPLIKTRGGFCIFDFVNGRIEHYTSDNEQIKTVPVFFHKQKGWKKQIYYDEIRDKIYQLFEVNSIGTVKEIDMDSGSILYEVALKDFSFAENIRVHDGTVYFIARNPDNHLLRQIFRIRLN